MAASFSTLSLSSLLFLFLSLSAARASDDEVRSMHAAWMVMHGKTYNALGETEKRFGIFKENLRYIDEQNALPNRSFQLGLTPFADLTNDEYRKAFPGTGTGTSRRLIEVEVKSGPLNLKVGDSLPKSVDWRKKGAVAPIKRQGSCASDWAFAAIAAVEGVNAIVTGELIPLSEQEVLDCNGSSKNGCRGGEVENAYAFIINNKGIGSEADYPYVGRVSKCIERKNNTSRVVTIDGFEHVTPNDESALQKAVAAQPVAVAIDSGWRDFQFYRSGVLAGPCGVSGDHKAVVVGYGRQNGLDYWLVRNSWGPKWGESGYFKLQRNVKAKSGLCGIAVKPSYPVKNPPPV